MRRGQGSGTEAEFDSQLEEIIALIGFTPDKDVFKAFYSTQLAKRLLLNKSASDDMERNMIIKLQQGELSWLERGNFQLTSQKWEKSSLLEIS
jgi:cullin-4